MSSPDAALNAEQAVIGGLILAPHAYDRIAWLPTEAFLREDHRLIYTAIVALIEGGKAVDALLVAEELQRRGQLERVGGQRDIGSMALNTPTAANITRYADLVMEAWSLRRLQEHAQIVLMEAAEPGANPGSIADKACEAFLSVAEAKATGEPVSFERATKEAVDWLESPVKGLSTGYSALDRVIGALRPGEYIILAGRPSMGKSALCSNIAEHVGQEHPVAYFSVEMTRRQVAARALRYHESLTDRSQAFFYLADIKIMIDDSPTLTVGALRLRLQRIKRTHGLALVVVDYLQRMQGRGENRTQEIGSISRGLATIAKDLGVPLIAAAQLNRAAEGRTDKRPLLSDLRESGDVEQDADVVAFIYRDEYYHPASKNQGYAEIIVRKHRDGPTGTAWLRFEPEYARFKDYAGPAPEYNVPAKSTVSNFHDYKRAAAGDSV